MDKTELQTAIDVKLRVHGFRRRNSTWYRVSQTGTEVIDLQKSLYGMQFYVNVAIVPKGMEVRGKDWPMERECPIRVRYAAAFPQDKSDIDRVLNLEYDGLGDHERRGGINELMSLVVARMFDGVGDLSALKSAIEDGVYKAALVSRTAQAYLGIDKDC